ncbi:MAG: glycosyltransferase family 2 protein [Desulfovibrionaceae bacterium]
MLTIILPMAGHGSRFTKAGYTTPKPFIPIHTIPMIQLVVANLTPTCEHRFIFICQKEHNEKYNLQKTLSAYAKNIEIITVDDVTEGQACTALLAKQYCNNEYPVITANTDQYIDADINEFINTMYSRSLDGLIMTMESQDPKWSYAKCDNNALVTETAEKQVLSTHATVGIFAFAKGIDFISATEQMIADNIRINNEFYICPAYNYLIRDTKAIGIYPIGEEYNGMYGLGTPEDLNFFLQHEISRKAIQLC